jgi:hypothetical protein
MSDVKKINARQLNLLPLKEIELFNAKSQNILKPPASVKCYQFFIDGNWQDKFLQHQKGKKAPSHPAARRRCSRDLDPGTLVADAEKPLRGSGALGRRRLSGVSELGADDFSAARV